MWSTHRKRAEASAKVTGNIWRALHKEKYDDLGLQDQVWNYNEAERAVLRGMFNFVCFEMLSLGGAQRAARDKLERRIDAMETKSLNLADAYQGTWREGMSVKRGALCTSNGSLWLATKATVVRPGSEDSGWRLVTKRGRDATRAPKGEGND